MKIIHEGYKHDNLKPEQVYGCECENCESAFTFVEHEITRPRTPFCSDKDCSINCPVCSSLITLDKCIKFTDASDEMLFKLFYND